MRVRILGNVDIEEEAVLGLGERRGAGRLWAGGPGCTAPTGASDGVGGCGGVRRAAPAGESAWRMPKKTLTPAGSLGDGMPTKGPVSVATVCAEAVVSGAAARKRAARATRDLPPTVVFFNIDLFLRGAMQKPAPSGSGRNARECGTS
jgi:hypothetical protein